MGKRRIGKSMGWFGWSLLITIFTVGIGSMLFFFNIFNLDIKMLSSADQEQEEREEQGDQQEKDTAEDETIEAVENIQETVGKEYSDIGIFVSDMHDFYNETTGYGSINSLDWKQQIDQAEIIQTTLQEKMATINNEALKNDLENIQSLADQVTKQEKTDLVRDLHRMFHDLDIALNSYNGYDKIWNVTETLKSLNNK